jgi:hypothetical protein
MKPSLFAVSLLLLVVAIFGVSKAYSLPAETLVSQEVTLLDYEHQGKFDYVAFLKPSYLYGPEPQEPPPPPPEVMKYPAGIIDFFDLTFSYRFVPERPVAGTSGEVEVRAIIKSPGAREEQEITLMPRTSETRDFTITFPLDISDNVSDNYITIGDNITGSDITITAYVYTTIETDTGPIFESFTQSLPMRVIGPLIEVEGNLDHTSPGFIGELNYEQYGEFDYEVHLKPNSGFGPITLKPPAAISPAPAPLKTVSNESTIMSRLLEGMDVSFTYHLESSKSIRKLGEAVTIEAILGNPEKWSKTIELVPLTDKNDDFTVTFPLDLRQFSELFDAVQQETGVSDSARNLTIKAKVHALADTDFGTLDTDFTHSIEADLKENMLVWTDNLTKFEPGSIKGTEFVPQAEKYLGLPVSRIRIPLAVAAGILFIILVFSLLWNFWHRQEKLTVMGKKAQQAQRKYKNIIVEIKELPELKPGETVILLYSLDELIRTAEGLFKPVLHKAEGQRHIYCVLDAAIRYEHHLG